MDKKEVLRYLRTRSDTEEAAILALVDRACNEIERAAVPKTLYRIFDCCVDESGAEIGGARFESKRLAATLKGCHRAVVFGATLGVGVDRLIQSALAGDVALAMAYQASAAAKIEEVCDALEAEICNAFGVTLRRRYSPGYFDLGIEAQHTLFSLLELTKRIGLTLTDTLEMVPTKSVTAIIGIEE